MKLHYVWKSKKFVEQLASTIKRRLVSHFFLRVLLARSSYTLTLLPFSDVLKDHLRTTKQ
ncbi:hypothetical protein DPMN_013603 [Dreissena polymorpha]|uniref:Uncharacterized protein n=1 Tax=Dreissena polymorpha TaxID=45954 RepID=A0A9D4S1Z4_DREPO|nr:hypothetical protein DPMN_013600 [Dreissena polymorpha]KAH3889544.1 hypothetical protein DPMN_013603 [Dreissena polymorpha]